MAPKCGGFNVIFGAVLGMFEIGRSVDALGMVEVERNSSCKGGAMSELRRVPEDAMDCIMVELGRNPADGIDEGGRDEFG